MLNILLPAFSYNFTLKNTSVYLLKIKTRILVIGLKYHVKFWNENMFISLTKSINWIKLNFVIISIEIVHKSLQILIMFLIIGFRRILKFSLSFNY